ncbi:TPA: adenylate cyclase [Candidatus Micrarchaeota archaeon]|nr:adenylate cyclase [Candidatus Micrarchaeota archaeon]
MEVELERTFLAKRLPQGIESSPRKDVLDIYIPAAAAHPVLRIRKAGDKTEITKKQPLQGNASEQGEYTITLTPVEYHALSQIDGKKLHKHRYAYSRDGRTAEVDVFQNELKGLVLADFEFKTREEKEAFAPPDWCGADVTHETFVAGGMLCGKKYSDVEAQLKKYDCQPILK